MPPKDEIVLCTYNVERGLRLDDQLRAFDGDAVDVVLLACHGAHLRTE